MQQQAEAIRESIVKYKAVEADPTLIHTGWTPEVDGRLPDLDGKLVLNEHPTFRIDLECGS
jgi:hypothetical protein